MSSEAVTLPQRLKVIEVPTFRCGNCNGNPNNLFIKQTVVGYRGEEFILLIPNQEDCSKCIEHVRSHTIRLHVEELQRQLRSFYSLLLRTNSGKV